MKRTILHLALILLAACPVMAATAADEPAGKSIYYTLTPAFVGNYGAGEGLRYYKADVALRVASEAAESRVRHHEPLIRNQLVMLFSQQTEDSLASVEAKQQLRQEALKQVQDVLVEEEGEPLVEDLLFNNLVIQ